MISGGDQKVRSAFRAKLRDEPSRPSVAATEKLSPDDVLEVRDLASAIARAEQLIRSSPSSRPRDIFDALLEGDASAPDLEALGDETDDCSGPALPAFDDPDTAPGSIPNFGKAAAPPVVPASVTPAMHETSGQKTGERAAKTLQLPVPSVTVTQRLPILYVNDDEDAFYQPAGRIRSLADATLEAYRPEPTLLVRLRNRRRSLSWIASAILVPLTLLAGATLLRSRSEASTRPAAPKTEIAKPTEAPKAVEGPKSVESPKTGEVAKPVPVIELARQPEAPKPAAAKTEMPVLDVNSLPAAPARRR